VIAKTCSALWIGLALAVAPAVAQSQRQMTDSESAKYAAADKIMTHSYELLMAKISPAGQIALRDAQRSWLKFRDDECGFETLGSVGGSVHPMAFLSCKTRLTRARTAGLDAQYKCPEGDIACGGQ
jgi:uncharacterized protein YecT (DUF1311 family)